MGLIGRSIKNKIIEGLVRYLYKKETGKDAPIWFTWNGQAPNSNA